MVWALCWIAQQPFNCPTTVHYDNSTTGPYAAGVSLWKEEWEHVHLQRHLQHLRHCLQAEGRVIHFHHEKSHVGHPWNEAVDSLAKAFAKGVLTHMPLPENIPTILQNKGFPFAWLSLSQHVQAPRPYAFPGCFQAEGPFFQNRSTPPDVSWCPNTEQLTTEDARINLVLATANVLTLEAGSTRQQQRGLMQYGRISTLQAQFRQAKCHIVGLQECRTAGQFTRHSATHLVYQSGCADDGCRGCELWIDREQPYAVSEGHSFVFQAQHVHIASFSDRHLLAILRAPHLHIRILVLHAPYVGAVGCACDSWWNDIDRLVTSASPHLPLVILGDLNSHFGTHVSESISSHAAEAENEAGHHAHAFLLEHKLWAPSTFESHHHGRSHTWTSSQGISHRLDYVIVPTSWKAFDVYSWVMDAVDLATARQDHFVAAVQVQMVKAKSNGARQHRCKVDVRRCHDAAQVQAFHRYLKTMPNIPWETGVGEHAELLIKWIQKGVSQHFAPTTQLPRQRYMSEVTWQVVQLRKQLLVMSEQAIQHVRLIDRRIVFLIWKRAMQSRHHHHRPIHEPVHQMIHQLRHLKWACLKTELWAVKARRQMHATARAMSRQDRITKAQDVLKSFHDAALSHDTRKLYAALRPLLGQTGRKACHVHRPLPAVKHPTKGVIDNADAAAECWRAHFATPEHGILVTPQQLQELALVQFPRYDLPHIELDWTTIPTLGQIEQVILRARRNKSPGPDGIPSEVYQIDPSKFSVFLWPLITKTVLRCEEPLRWRGGEVVALPKCVNTGIVIDNFRSILLADVASKISHSLLRQKLLPAYERYRFPMQAGGVPKLSTDMLHLFVQSFAQLCRSRNVSHGALFVDIKQAFYKACRPLLCFRHVSDCQIAQFFLDNGWSPSMYHDFQGQLHQPDALTQAKVSPHNRSQVQAILTSTWFQLRNAPATLTATASGTRPGDAVADLLFGFLMTRFIGRLREQFKVAGLHTSLELQWIPPGPLSPDDMPHQDIIQACWADDLVLLLQDPSPAQLVDHVRTAATITQSTAVEFAMQLNYGVNKTAVVLHLRGQGTRAVWQDMMVSDGDLPCLTFSCDAIPTPCTLTVVPDYVYLGSLQDLSGTPACEIKRRFLMLQATKKILNRNIFRSPRMPFQTKKLLFKSLVLSKLLYGAGAWQAPHIHTLKSWHTKVIGLYRNLVPHVPKQEGVYDLDVIAACKLPHPLMLLSLQRFSLFDRLMQTETTELLAVLQHQPRDQGWFSLIRADLIHLAILVPHMQLTTWADMCDDQQIAQFCFERPKALRSLGKQACKVYEGYLTIWHQFRAFQKQFHDDLVAWHVRIHSCEVVVAPGASYACHLCAATFHDYKSLCGHIFKKHGIANIAQRYAATNVCRGCLKTYHSREQVLHHLKYFRTGCLLKLSVTVPPITDEELQEILESEAHHKAACKTQQRNPSHKWPVMTAHGPQRPWPWHRTLSQMRHDLRLQPEIPPDALQQWTTSVLQQCSNADVSDTLAVLRQYEFHGTLASHLHAALAALSPEPLTPAFVEQQLVLNEALEFWAHDALVPLTPCSSDPPLQVAQFALNEIRVPQVAKHDSIIPHTERRRQLTAEMWSADDVVQQLQRQLQHEHQQMYTFPPSMQRHVCQKPVFLYVFSGRRRPGDVQEHLHRYLEEFDIDGTILLIDLALSDRHDVTNPKLIELLIHWVRSGYVAGLITAPPCETWSQARYQLTTSPKDPRPVRSAANPLCISGLTSAELTQISVANVLLYTSIRLLVSAALSGVPGVLEHPLEPQDPTRPSIWRLPWLRMMHSNGLIKQHVIQQAKYGATAIKPTTLATCHLPAFKQSMAKFTVPVQWHLLEKLTGRRSDGTWKTASAKEYPSRMNQGLAYSLATVHQHAMAACPIFQADEEFLAAVRFLYAGDVDFDAQVMCPDYGGHVDWDLLD
eukprot:Skav220568  [mRNA]  locus=scaffold2140:124648:130443:+ [translate_table: standard]